MHIAEEYLGTAAYIEPLEFHKGHTTAVGIVSTFRMRSVGASRLPTKFENVDVVVIPVCVNREISPSTACISLRVITEPCPNVAKPRH